MKLCPKCQRTYSDDTLIFCLDDGSLLSAPSNTQAAQQKTLVLPDESRPRPTKRSEHPYLIYAAILAVAGLLILILGVGTVTWIILREKDEPANTSLKSSPSPSPEQSGVKDGTSPKPTPTTEERANLSDMIIRRQMVGSWSWSDNVFTFSPDGTGIYYSGVNKCFTFNYSIKDKVMRYEVTSTRRCGPTGEAGYRISIEGSTMTMVYIENGYTTEWKPTRPPTNSS